MKKKVWYSPLEDKIYLVSPSGIDGCVFILGEPYKPWILTSQDHLSLNQLEEIGDFD